MDWLRFTSELPQSSGQVVLDCSYSATLVLLGDRDQLASVEAGSAWAQLCEGAEQAQVEDDAGADQHGKRQDMAGIGEDVERRRAGERSCHDAFAERGQPLHARQLVTMRLG